jgi:2-iminobutanoate/2-iminopropanoate deaminase
MTPATPCHRPSAALAALLLVFAAACEGANMPADDQMPDAAPTVEFVNPRSPADGEVPPFSGAVWVDNTFYLSGMLGLEGGQVPETAEQEAANVLDAMKAVLEGEGLTMDDLVVVQVFASDVADYGALNSVYRTYFTGEFPARAFLGSGTLLFNARFEVMGTAVRR